MATRKKSTRASRVATGAQEKLLGTVHQVWLAGLGAVSKAQSGAPKLLDELITEGARVHARAVKATDEAVRSLFSTAQTAIRGRVDDAREKASDTLENLEGIFQTRVHRALKQLGVPSAEQVAGLSKRVDVLNANIEKLARKGATGRKSRPNGRRAAAGQSPAH